MLLLPSAFGVVGLMGLSDILFSSFFCCYFHIEFGANCSNNLGMMLLLGSAYDILLDRWESLAFGNLRAFL